MSNVTPIREADEPPLGDVPAMLRKLAGDIEANVYGPVAAAAVVLEAKEMPIFGYGRADPVNASELFSAAHYKLVRARLQHLEAEYL